MQADPRPSVGVSVKAQPAEEVQHKAWQMCTPTVDLLLTIGLGGDIAPGPVETGDRGMTCTGRWLPR